MPDLHELISAVRRELKPRKTVRLMDDEIAVQTANGFWLVVPAWNIDVAIGIIRDGIIEPWTNAVFIDHLTAGDTVVNVGANFGYYAALAAQHVGPAGKVYAIEANPVVFPYLVKSMFWSGFPNIVSAYNFAAVGREQNGKIQRFSYDPQFIGGGNLFSRAGDDAQLADCLWSARNVESILDENRMFIPRGLYSDIDVPGKTVDSILNGPVDAMLIDAEGSECYVIDGARDTIRTSPGLKIVMEWDPHSYRTSEERRGSIDAMWHFLIDEMGYSVSRICPESYPGAGLPELQALNRLSLFDIPHSDLILARDA